MPWILVLAACVGIVTAASITLIAIWIVCSEAYKWAADQEGTVGLLVRILEAILMIHIVAVLWLATWICESLEHVVLRIRKAVRT